MTTHTKKFLPHNECFLWSIFNCHNRRHSLKKKNLFHKITKPFYRDYLMIFFKINENSGSLNFIMSCTVILCVSLFKSICHVKIICLGFSSASIAQQDFSKAVQTNCLEPLFLLQLLWRLLRVSTPHKTEKSTENTKHHVTPQKKLQFWIIQIK